MTRAATVLAFLIVTSAAAQMPNSGSICGTVLDENGQPAKQVLVVAFYLGAHSGPNPAARSDDTGHYCLEHVPFGTNMPSVDDPKRGYPEMWAGFYSPKPFDQETNNTADLSAAHPHATIDFRIPYKAAFVTIHLADAITGQTKSTLNFRLRAQLNPAQRYIYGSQGAADALLVPPNENILLNASSPGYREWPYDRSPGYLVNLLPGEHKTIDVELQPK